MTEASSSPARRYSWPPFEPGNQAAVTHGAYSARVVQPVADKIIQSVLADPDLPFLHLPSMIYELTSWAQAEARVILIEQYVDGMSIERAAESDRGQTSPLELLRKWEATAATRRDKLGLNPTARAKLGRNTAAGAADTARLMGELHRQQQERDSA